uniref:Uncharacterized protein n=1 Tax=Anopheles melas TaxID=34690 RepID=A0A182TRH1_9DIPT
MAIFFVAGLPSTFSCRSCSAACRICCSSCAIWSSLSLIRSMSFRLRRRDFSSFFLVIMMSKSDMNWPLEGKRVQLPSGSPQRPYLSDPSSLMPSSSESISRDRDRDRERDREPEPDLDRERDPEPDREREPEPERERERDCERERDRERDREPDPERDRDRDGVRTRRCDDRRLPERLRLRLTLAEWLTRGLRDRRLWRDRLRLLREPASLTSEPLRRRRRSGCDVWLSREPLRLRCGECIFPSSPSDAAVSSTVAPASFSLSTGAEGTAASSCCCCCCCSFPSPASSTVWAVSSGSSFGSTVGSSSLMVVIGSSPFGGCGTTATGSPTRSHSKSLGTSGVEQASDSFGKFYPATLTYGRANERENFQHVSSGKSKNGESVGQVIPETHSQLRLKNGRFLLMFWVLSKLG